MTVTTCIHTFVTRAGGSPSPTHTMIGSHEKDKIMQALPPIEHRPEWRNQQALARQTTHNPPPAKEVKANRKVLLSDGTLYIKDFLDCSRDGIEYTRDCPDGTIYNADFVEVGKWCTSFGDGFIEFSNEGAKKHFEATGRTLPN